MLTEYTCPRCTAKGFPGFTMDMRNRMVAQCPKCQFEDPAFGPADFSQGIAAVDPDGNAGPGWAGRTAVAVELAPTRMASSPQVSRIANAPTAPAAPAPMTPADVISMVEARSAWLVSEEARLEGEIAEGLARLAGVRAEKRRLDKMLTAGQPRERRMAPRVLRAVNQ